jgi:hypothetical protein
MRSSIGGLCRPAYAARSFPALRPGTCSWWRRGDSAFHGFRHGLDYAFIRALPREPTDAERIIRNDHLVSNPSARPGMTASAGL